MKVYKHNHLCIFTLFLLTSHIAAIITPTDEVILPWDSLQQNDDFLRLLIGNPPVGINIFSHYDAATGVVPDARGSNYDITVTDGQVQFPPVDASGVSIVSQDTSSAKMTITGAQQLNGE